MPAITFPSWIPPLIDSLGLVILTESNTVLALHPVCPAGRDQDFPSPKEACSAASPIWLDNAKRFALRDIPFRAGVSQTPFRMVTHAYWPTRQLFNYNVGQHGTAP